ncbi:RsmB/NOP family class I SAM-dependent RNA methyltransferase [Novosphingobium sp. JCM 18896]|uniref:RsmB/NOP family class I SAM-dependent RNA methyltransferase n=1 Tax=Novosphingobium sp. JCM 18896 TaxID=2989731 RepID=UPI002222E79C|nr:RsmB/NOP family class I SAM-dependent RNA methyltransferase [Novosphingobium sp. JCM 18896]MCW1431297.1 RsmB/NOP family class I SAM-dependent RNA methyltransferase [Novosphingobium sp. JCM 18896]
MTPAARVQAAIEVLDLVIAAARDNGAPADRLISDWFKSRRFAGSGDRRAVRELAYAAIRACGEIPESGRAAMLLLAQDDAALATLFDGSRHAPAPIAPDEPVAQPGVAPAWLEQALADSGLVGAEAAALLDRAPLDLRINTLKADRATIELPSPGEATVAAQGLRLPFGTPVEQWDAYKAGRIEVQDTGSQLTCEALAAQPGETVIDLCAGAGGKTLALAAAMANRGRLIASDADRARLSRLMPRAERAGVSIVETVLLDTGREAEALAAWQAKADAVLVDAPCSGVGTWRRNPEARWRLTEKQLARYVALQARLLDLAATLVRPGGRLVYVTCSLLDREGAGQVDAFLARHGEWQATVPMLPAGQMRGEGLRLSPFHDGTDGFFVAILTRSC